MLFTTSPFWSLLLAGAGFGLIPAGRVLLFILTNLLTTGHAGTATFGRGQEEQSSVGTEPGQEASAGGCTGVLQLAEGRNLERAESARPDLPLALWVDLCLEPAAPS